MVPAFLCLACIRESRPGTHLLSENTVGKEERTRFLPFPQLSKRGLGDGSNFLLYLTPFQDFLGSAEKSYLQDMRKNCPGRTLELPTGAPAFTLPELTQLPLAAVRHAHFPSHLRKVPKVQWPRLCGYDGGGRASEPGISTGPAPPGVCAQPRSSRCPRTTNSACAPEALAASVRVA